MVVGSGFYDYDQPVRRLLTTGHLAYLKIAEGCNHRCAFCVIPQIRGKFRSRHPQSLVQEAVSLRTQGVQELLVIAQDTTAYGRDLERVSLALSARGNTGCGLSLGAAALHLSHVAWRGRSRTVEQGEYAGEVRRSTPTARVKACSEGDGSAGRLPVYNGAAEHH